MKLLVLSAREVVQALPMAAAVEGMKRAFGQLSAGKATVPLRSHVNVPQHNGTSLIMPAYLAESGDLAVKIVSVFPNNAAQNLPVINGVVLAFDHKTGQPVALMDGGALTAIRTGAASGAATDLLARSDAHTVAIFGSGVQARTQLEAVCTVRPIETVRVYSPDQAHAVAFAAEMAGHGPIPAAIEVMGSAEAAAAEADIICTATSSGEPVFPGTSLKPGVHINAVGVFMTSMREVDTLTIQQSLVVVDEYDAMRAEAGDIMIPLEAGEIDEGHIHAELGEIVNGTKSGRTNPEQITFFKSVGVAVQDAVAASLAVRGAAAHNLGIYISI